MASTLEVLTTAQVALLMNRPSAFLYQNASQSVGSGAYTALTYNVAQGDIWGGWSSGNPSRYTVQVAGTYEISWFTAWSSNSTGSRQHYAQQNGSQINGTKQELPAMTTTMGVASPVFQVPANVGDYFQVQIYQDTGNPLATYATAPFFSSMTVKWLHI